MERPDALSHTRGFLDATDQRSAQPQLRSMVAGPVVSSRGNPDVAFSWLDLT